MITIYTIEGCSGCVRSKNILKSRDIPFREMKLGHDFDMDTFELLYPGVKTFPYIINGDVIVGGYPDLVEKIAENNDYGKLILKE